MSASPRRLAVVAIGTLKVGIDVDGVVQALPVPPALAPLPRRRGALAGVIDCDGRLIPVADLSRWVDTGAAGAAGASSATRIVVLRDGPRRIGLLADAIDGFADVPDGGVTRLHHDDDPEEVFQSAVRMPGSDTILAVLEAARLVALACVWHDGEAERDDTHPDARAEAVAGAAGSEGPGHEAAQGTVDQYAVLQAGATLLALPAVRLAAVLPRPPLDRVGLGGAAFCRWGERHVPVVDAPTAAPQVSRALLAIVEHDGAALGIAIDAALDMRALPRPDAGVSVVYDEAGQALVCVDVPALFARHPEAALSKANGPSSAAARQGNEAEQLVFEAGGVLATPLAEIEQVLPFDGAAVGGHGGPAGTAGAAEVGGTPATLPWHGRAIPVADLRAEDARGAQGAVLVLRAGGGHVACIVERVRSLVPRGAGRIYSLAAAGQGKPTRFITVQDGAGEASYRIVDLAERVRLASA